MQVGHQPAPHRDAHPAVNASQPRAVDRLWAATMCVPGADLLAGTGLPDDLLRAGDPTAHLNHERHVRS